jgi:TetR/AcrR family transcriptional regulator, mexJK operon transcriptional repressor
MSSSPPPTSLPARSAQKREAILSAGRTHFLAHGYQGTSVDQIAASAEVSKQTVYKHFGDKRELLLAIVTAVVEATVTPFVARIAALATTEDLEGDLVALGIDYLDAVLAAPVVQLRRLVIGEANNVPELARSYYERAPEQTLRAFADTFGALHQRGALFITDKDWAAEHFAFLVIGRSIDRALFFGGPATLADLDVAGYVRAGVRVFLAAYGTRAD